MNLQLNCVDQSPHHLPRHHAGGLHLLGEEARHEDVTGWTDSQTIGEAGDHEAGQLSHGEGGKGEAKSHHQHGEGGDQQEDGVYVPGVKPGLEERCEEVSECNSGLQDKVYLLSLSRESPGL